MKKLGRTAAMVAALVWLVFALFPLGQLNALDPASGILDGLSLVVGGVGVYSLGRAIDAGHWRPRALWAGRGLAILGAAFAIAFPAILFGEIVMLIQRGRPLTYDLEAAIWHSFWTMPFTVIPALVALRWSRIGGLMFLALAAYQITDGFVHFGGVNYFPEARADVIGVLLANAPAVITGVALLVASEGWHGESEDRLVLRTAHAVP